MKTFQSLLSKGGNPIRPQLISIDDKSITISQRSQMLISKNETKINFNSISNVTLSKNPIFSNIRIVTNGGSEFTIDNLDHNDAKQIVKLLE